jgi:two-component system NarL family sensor kinase
MERPAAVARLAAILKENESRAAEVARLLHDDVGPTLSAVGFQLAALRADPAITAEIRGYLEQAIDAVRVASQKLHADPVARSGLPIALEMLVDRLRNEYGMHVELTVQADRRVPPGPGYAIYRVVELALENVRRHAGDCRAEVRLTANADGITAQIRDDGPGFDADAVRTHPPGTGLILMESYTGGNHSLHLRIDSTPGKGTIIEILTI